MTNKIAFDYFFADGFVVFVFFEFFVVDEFFVDLTLLIFFARSDDNDIDSDLDGGCNLLFCVLVDGFFAIGALDCTFATEVDALF